MTEAAQPGPDRSAADLTAWTVEQMLPIDPVETADSMSLQTIQSRLMGQFALVEGLKSQRNELNVRLDFETNQLNRLQEALLLASDRNPGAPQPSKDDRPDEQK